MSSLASARASLVRAARRYSRVAHEVEDLAHDILLAALRRGEAVDDEAFLRSAVGAARRHAAFVARTAARRRGREAKAAEHGPVEASVGDRGVEPSPLAVLPPALRTTLLLLAQGLEKAELRVALGVTDAALRKRFQALREMGPLDRPDLQQAERGPAAVQARRSQIALLPRLVIAREASNPEEGEAGRILAVHDPDGHGILFSEALTSRRPTATTR